MSIDLTETSLKHIFCIGWQELFCASTAVKWRSLAARSPHAHRGDYPCHDAGDELLKQIAIRFRRQIPSGSILARLGGDEFGAIIYGNRTHGLEIAQALQASLAYPAHLGSHSVTMSVSIGAAINDGKPELMRRVDEAMYQSKKAGGGLTLVEL